MEDFIHKIGYLALLVGTFFEGETSLLVASALSSSGATVFFYVVFFGFLGSFLSDWLYFLIGRINGRYFVDRRPSLKEKLVPVNLFFQSNRIQLLLSYRFLYGFRIVIPLMIGMTNIRAVQFLFFSSLSGLVWATFVSSIGYFIGYYFELDSTFFKEQLVFIAIGFASFGLLLALLINHLSKKLLLKNPR
jgi:membrane protein DedA with SNARE-associated domain